MLVGKAFKREHFLPRSKSLWTETGAVLDVIPKLREYLSLRFRSLHTCPSPYKAVTKGGESDQKKDLRRNTNFLLQQLNMTKILLLCLVAATLLAFTGGLLVMH